MRVPATAPRRTWVLPVAALCACALPIVAYYVRWQQVCADGRSDPRHILAILACGLAIERAYLVGLAGVAVALPLVILIWHVRQGLLRWLAVAAFLCAAPCFVFAQKLEPTQFYFQPVDLAAHTMLSAALIFAILGSTLPHLDPAISRALVACGAGKWALTRLAVLPALTMTAIAGFAVAVAASLWVAAGNMVINAQENNLISQMWLIAMLVAGLLLLIAWREPQR